MKKTVCIRLALIVAIVMTLCILMLVPSLADDTPVFPGIKKANMTLNDSLRINFYILKAEVDASESDVTVTAEYDAGGETPVSIVLSKVDNGGEYYRYSISDIAARNMQREYTIKVNCGEITESYTYSAFRYMENMRENASVKSLIEAMAVYGNAAEANANHGSATLLQNFFGAEGFDAEKYIADCFCENGTASVAEYDFSQAPFVDSIGLNLVDGTICPVICLADGHTVTDVEVSFHDDYLNEDVSGSYKPASNGHVTVDCMKPTALNTPATLTFRLSDSSTVTATWSIANYVESALTSPIPNENQLTLTKALAIYMNEAQKYANGTTSGAFCHNYSYCTEGDYEGYKCENCQHWRTKSLIPEPVDESKLFDLSNATGATAVTIYNESMNNYRTNVSKRLATNYAFEVTDIFKALTGQEKVIKFTKPTNGDNTGLQIKLSEKFGSTGTKPTDFDELVFYIKSNFDTKGYKYSALQLDFVALNAANGQEYSGGWKQRVKDNNKNGQTVRITINRAQLEKWGDSWDNAMIWVYFVTEDRWDLGLASNDFYLYMSSIVGNKFESVDDSKLFDLSNATGATAVTIYNENMTDYRTGASKRWAANYTFEETDIFTALTGQEAALKFTKPTNGTDTGLQIRLSEKFGSSGTKPTDFDELVFYIKSNFDTKGYTFSALQLDFVALNAANGQEYENGWRQRVHDSNKNGQIVKITVDRAQLERWGDSWDNAMIWVHFVTGGRWDLGLASNDFYLYISSIVGNTVDKSKLFDLSNETGATAVTIYNEYMNNYRNGTSKRLATNYTFEETDIFTELTGQETALKFTKPTNGTNTGLQIKLSEKFGSTGTKPTDFDELVFYIQSNFDTKGYTYPTLQLDFVALNAANGLEDGWRQRVHDSNKNGTIVEITIDRAQLERWGDSWDNAMIWVLFVTGGRWDLGLASDDFYLYISSITGTPAEQ